MGKDHTSKLSVLLKGGSRDRRKCLRKNDFFQGITLRKYVGSHIFHLGGKQYFFQKSAALKGSGADIFKRVRKTDRGDLGLFLKSFRRDIFNWRRDLYIEER